MLYYKVIHGFDTEDSLTIEQGELEKAIYAFMAQGRVAFKNGAVDGRRIIAIQPDYHEAMGWSRGHKLTADDYNELSDQGVDRAHKLFQAKAKERVEYLVSHNQIQLIGKGVDIPELDSSKPQLRGGTVADNLANVKKRYGITD